MSLWIDGLTVDFSSFGFRGCNGLRRTLVLSSLTWAGSNVACSHTHTHTHTCTHTHAHLHTHTRTPARRGEWWLGCTAHITGQLICLQYLGALHTAREEGRVCLTPPTWPAHTHTHTHTPARRGEWWLGCTAHITGQQICLQYLGALHTAREEGRVCLTPPTTWSNPAPGHTCH